MVFFNHNDDGKHCSIELSWIRNVLWHEVSRNTIEIIFDCFNQISRCREIQELLKRKCASVEHVVLDSVSHVTIPFFTDIDGLAWRHVQNGPTLCILLALCLINTKALR